MFNTKSVLLEIARGLGITFICLAMVYGCQSGLFAKEIVKTGKATAYGIKK